MDASDIKKIDDIRAAELSKHKYVTRTCEPPTVKYPNGIKLAQCQCGAQLGPLSAEDLDSQITEHLSKAIRQAFKDTPYEGMPGTGGLSVLSR